MLSTDGPGVVGDYTRCRVGIVPMGREGVLLAGVAAE